MSRVVSERERRVAKKVAEEAAQDGETVNWLSLAPHIDVGQLVKIDRQAEAAAAEENMRRIAERDAKIAEKYGGPEAWERVYKGPTEEHRRLNQKTKTNPELTPGEAKAAVTADLILAEGMEEDRQAGLDDQANRLIDKANRRRQKGQRGKPPNRLHPIVQQEIIPERRLERELNPKRKPAREDWKIRIANSLAWQEALKWFRMAPAEAAAAEAEIETAVNTEIGVMAQAMANQAEWNAIDPETLAQMDFFGYVWPTGEK